MDLPGQIWSTLGQGSGGIDEPRLSSYRDAATTSVACDRLGGPDLPVQERLLGPRSQQAPRSGPGHRGRPGKRW